LRLCFIKIKINQIFVVTAPYTEAKAGNTNSWHRQGHPLLFYRLYYLLQYVIFKDTYPFRPTPEYAVLLPDLN